MKRTLTRADNTFALFFVLVNLPETRKYIAKQLIKQLHRPVVEISVSQEALQDTTLDARLLQQLKAAPEESVVFLHNLQEILPTEKKALRHYLQQLNYRRSSLAAIQRPLVIWLPRYAIDKLAEYAADFYDWYSNVYEFIPSAEDFDQITSRFVTEFESKDVHPAKRMSSAEKQRWLHTLTALLDENPDQNKFRAELLGHLGRLHDAIGNLDNALKHYEQSLAIQQEIGDKSGEGTTLNNISQIYDARDDYDTALKYLKQSLAIRQEIGDKSGEGTTLNNISQIYDARGDYDTALKYLKQSLAIQREIGDIAGLCATLFNIGHIHYQNKEIPQSLQAWVEVYRLAKPVNLAQALDALENLAKQIELPGGTDGWERLARQKGMIGHILKDTTKAYDRP